MSLWNALFGNPMGQPLSQYALENQAYKEQLALGLQNRDDLRYEYWATRLNTLALNEEEKARVLAIVDEALARHAAKCIPVA